MLIVRDVYERHLWERRLKDFRELLDAHPPTPTQREFLELPDERGRCFVIAVLEEEVAEKVLGILGREQARATARGGMHGGSDGSH